jgi:hypothetical protein
MRKHTASIENFLQSDSAAAAVEKFQAVENSADVAAESILLATTMRRPPCATDFGNEGKKLKMHRPHDDGPVPVPRGPKETIMTVQRYGRIYRRRNQTSITVRKDGPPGTRWCRMCNAFQPVDAFYEKVKRYVCRRHHRLRVYEAQQRLKSKNTTPDLDCAASHAMSMLIDSYDAIGYEQGQIDEADIRIIIKGSKMPLELRPIVCPIDPTIGMWPFNIAVVSHAAFANIVNMYQITNSRALYVGIVQRCNLLPYNFDVSRHHDPFHDPTYRRVDMDVAEMFRTEVDAGVPFTMDQTLIAEIESGGNVPWNSTSGAHEDDVAKGRVATALKPVMEEKKRMSNPFLYAALELCSKKPRVFKAA